MAITRWRAGTDVLNEVLDAPFDSGRIRPRTADGREYGTAQWILMMVAGVAIGWRISWQVALWLMGCAYNIPPLRTKDVSYLDVPGRA